MAKLIKVLLVDDQTLVRQTLSLCLKPITGIEIVSAVDTAESAIDECGVHRPDVVLMDIDMPGLSCFEAATTIRARFPDTQIVLLSSYVHDHFIEEAIMVGVSGYVVKGDTLDGVIEAIYAAASGKKYFSPEVRSRFVLKAVSTSPDGLLNTLLSRLSERELEVLRHLARGMSKKEIAHTIHLSPHTVDKHASNLMNKLDIHDRVELSRFAIRERLVQP